jgi:flagellar hook-associated protein 1 FlgK
MSLTSILRSAASGMGAAQAGVQTASQNVSHANTAGYARSTLVLSARGDLRLSPHLAGQGVDASSVRSHYDRFREGAVIAGFGLASYASARETGLRAVEAALPSGDGGLSGAIDALWASFATLSAEPESMAARQDVLARGEDVAARIRDAAASLASSRAAEDRQFGERIAEANALGSTVAALTASIAQLEAAGGTATELRANRTAALESLAALGPVTVDEGGGEMTVIFAGRTLVEGGEARALSAVRDPATGLLTAHIASGSGTVDITASLAAAGRGSLAASLSVRDGTVASLQASLDELAYGLSNAVNAAHVAGFGLDGVSGRSFFAAPTAQQGAAAALALDATIVSNPAAVAAAGSSSGLPGGNDVAAALAALASNASFGPSSRTASAFAADLTVGLGHDVAAASSLAERHQTALSAAEALRDAGSAVSVDEEALDLVRFREAYQAAARVLATANDLFDELMRIV